MEIRSLISGYVIQGRSAMADTNLDGLRVMAFGMPTEPMAHGYEPVMGLVVQGAKRIVLGNRTFDAGAGQYLVGSLEVPLTSQVVAATADAPFLALSLKLKPAVIAELLLETSGSVLPAVPFLGMGVGQASVELLEALVRLLRLDQRPRDKSVLAPLVEREIHWHLLCGEQGAVLRQVGLSDPRLAQISQALHWIRSNYAKPLRIEELAQRTAMSVSTFHRHFRATTAMSPVQYQKQVRLQEARFLLMAQPEDVAAVGFAFGYDSPSQFSREYRRFYGLPPGQDAARLRHESLRDRLVLVD